MSTYRLLAIMVLGLTVLSAAQDSDESSIRTLLNEQAAAWNQGNGAGFANAFTDDSDFVNVRGDIFHGRAEIAARHSAILQGPFKGSHLAMTVRRFTLLTPGVALVETDQEMSGFQRMVPGITPTAEGLMKTHMKYVAVKRNGQWFFAAAQNTAVVPPPQSK